MSSLRRARVRRQARVELMRRQLLRAEIADLPCFRLACMAFSDHSSPAQEMRRMAFLRTRALVVFAWKEMPGFVTALPIMLILAASVGCEDVLEELVDKRQCALTAGSCAAAAKEGHLDALAWLHSCNCPWNLWTSGNAAYGGHLEVLRNAHEHGCPWDIYTCYEAAKGGHLDVLRYTYEQNCPWDVGSSESTVAVSAGPSIGTSQRDALCLTRASLAALATSPCARCRW
jgi:hypothetical protein